MISYQYHELTPAQKCLLTIAIGSPVFLAVLIYLSITIIQPDIEKVSNFNLMGALLTLFLILTIVFIVLGSWLWTHRYDSTAKNFSSWIIVLFSVLCLVSLGVSTGAYTSPAAPATITALLVGLALQPRYIVISGFILSVLGLGIYGTLAFMGVVPYAPLFVANTFVEGKPVFWWQTLRDILLYIGLLESALLIFLLFTWIDQKRELLEMLSRTDRLTGVSNRRYFMQRFSDEIVRQHKLAVPLSLAICDADHFKSVNDRFGHPVGDEVLQKIGELLSGLRRPDDTVARLGGEEFAIIFPATDLPLARQRCEHLRQLLQQQLFQADGQDFYVTMSIGITQGLTGDPVEELLQTADRNLYNAKLQGRNCVVATRHHQEML